MFKQGDRVRVKRHVSPDLFEYAGKRGTIVGPTERFIPGGGQEGLNKQKIPRWWVVLFDGVNEEMDFFEDDLELI